MINCETCVNRTAFGSVKSSTGHAADTAKCIVFGMEVYAECRGCDYWEKNPNLKRSDDQMPKVPSVNAHGCPKDLHEYNYSIPCMELVICTGCVYGKWYGGHRCNVHGPSGYGSGKMPNVHDNAMPTERDAITEELKRLLRSVEHDAKETPEAAAHIRTLIVEQRQLSLF